MTKKIERTPLKGDDLPDCFGHYKNKVEECEECWVYESCIIERG